jgi:hypothetical protein
LDTPFGPLPARHLPQMSMADRHEHLERAAISRRRFLRGAAVGGGVLLAGPTLWQQTARASVPPMSPHLQVGTDPRSTMVVSCPVTGPVVDVGLDDGFGRTVPAETRTVAGTSTHYHHAVVDRLAPGTSYRYRIGHDGATGEPSTFRTAPGAAEPFTFTAFGDQGVGAGAQETTATVAAQNPAFHFHVGDLCYAYKAGGLFDGPTDQAVWDDWFAQVSRGAAARVPWMPTVGNHEMESGYGPQGYSGFLSRFTLPSSTGAPGVPVTYAVRWGNVGLVALDANDTSYEIPGNRGYTAGAQDAWLERTLRALRADPAVDWIVVGYHHCSYCTNAVHASDGGPRERWGALFDAAGVDLVLNGHNHCYERTHPIRAGVVADETAPGGSYRPAETGTTYLTVGGGGQAAYQASLAPTSYVTVEGGARVPEAAPWSATRYLDLSLVAVDVVPPRENRQTTLTVRALTATGTELERVTLLRTSSAPVVTGIPAQSGTPAGAGTQPGTAAPRPAAVSAPALPATGAPAALTTAAVLTTAGAVAAGVATRTGTADDTESLR